MSFPSGHVQWAVSFYGLLAFLLWRNAQWFMTRISVVALFAGVVVLTMIGRMSLGRHWLIDVTAGAVAALLALRVVIVIDDRLGCRAHGQHEPLAPTASKQPKNV